DQVTYWYFNSKGVTYLLETYILDTETLIYQVKLTGSSGIPFGNFAGVLLGLTLLTLVYVYAKRVQRVEI
ncbi:MAG TPA: hypothetical protein VMV49_02970, partial [Candidatus Deferrimicrobium sp.]|nr:hypothetical protein [Candidatus Deferrimicrobium sp.]